MDELINASLQGRVIDENGTPVKDASINAGTNITSTDINGIFQLSNVQLYKYFGTVKIIKTGYFSVTKTFVTSTTGTTYVSIQLIPRVSKGSFSAGDDAQISIGNGSSVAVKANTLVTASSGSTFSGTVNVFAKYLDPTDPVLGTKMPGDLRGLDTAGKDQNLLTYGILMIQRVNGLNRDQPANRGQLM